jgi:hypothetical protein
MLAKLVGYQPGSSHARREQAMRWLQAALYSQNGTAHPLLQVVCSPALLSPLLLAL